MQSLPVISAKNPQRSNSRWNWLVILIILLIVAAVAAIQVHARMTNTTGARVSRLQHALYATSVARRQVGDDSYAGVYRVITRLDTEGDVVNVHTTLAPTDERQALLVQIALLNVSIDEHSGLSKFRIYDSSGAVLQQV